MSRAKDTTDQADQSPSPPTETETEAEEHRVPGQDTSEPGVGHLTGSAPSDIAPSPGAETGPGGPPPADDALSRALAERDEHLDARLRLQADFENYRKRVAKSQGEQAERSAGDLVSKLLPVLDTLDLALAHLAGTVPGAGDPASGAEPDPAAAAGSLAQVGTALTDTLAREGLERIDPQGQAFDPNQHDAVIHDPDGDGGEPTVTEVLRAGYRWKGRVLRPAMVKVRG
ncbi:MAG: nucleotide exchange factor GrpE [Acidimicrobiales bacterium]